MSESAREPLAVVHTGNEAEGAYVIEVPGVATPARLAWRARDPHTRIAVSTFVPEEMRGLGVAGQLLAALLADARAQGFRIVPQCPYVAAQFDRHPEWAELRA